METTDNTPWGQRKEVNKVRTTKSGYRISQNGNIIISIEPEAVQTKSFHGNVIKEDGTYYWYNRRQGKT